jgi:hypothetical protein
MSGNRNRQAKDESVGESFGRRDQGACSDFRDIRTMLATRPGVVGIGYGYRKGEEQGCIGLRLYIDSPKQWRRFGGDAIVAKLHVAHPDVSVDVVVHAGPGFACSSTPNLYPGDQIARDIDTNAIEQYGTAGLIVTSSQGGQSGRYVLTNAHVLAQGLASTTQDIYKPHKTTCNKPVAMVLSDPASTVYNKSYADSSFPGLSFNIDAALAGINAGIKSSNVNPEIAKKISQFGPTLRNLVTELSLKSVSSVADAKALNAAVAAKKIPVMKFGATTGFTRGLIIGVCAPTGGQTNAFAFQIAITPDPSEPDWEKTFTVDASEVADLVDSFDPSSQFLPLSVTLTPGAVSGAKQTIKLSGKIFCDHGDSGSAIVDQSGNIVGLLNLVSAVTTDANQSLNKGLGFAQFIVPAFDALGLPPNAVAPPGAPQSGKTLGAMGGIEAQAATERDILDVAAGLIGRTASGARLLRLAHMHLAEIQFLLHRHRRAMVAWHRNKGPAYIAAISRLLRHPGQAIPAEIDGVRLSEGLSSIRRVLSLEGSVGLKESLDEHGDWLIALLKRATEPEQAFRILFGSQEDAPAAARTRLRIVNVKGIPGTVSALVCCEDGVLRCLTNHHVLFGCDAGGGDTVFAIDESDGRGHMVAIGTTTRGHIGRVIHSGLPVFVDCALATLSEPANWPESLKRKFAALPIVNEIAEAIVGSMVTKNGAATGQTSGRIIDIAYPDRPFVDGRQHDAPGQLLIKPLSAAGIASGTEVNFCHMGDSGSAIFDADGKAVGLLWGANANGEGIACPIGPVLETLKVNHVEATPGRSLFVVVEK